jgi:cell division ATPase FtsA
MPTKHRGAQHRRASAPPLSRQTLAEVVEPRYEELFGLIRDELRRSGFEDLIAGGVVLTGGSAKMEGAVELAEEVFHMPVRLGTPQHVSGSKDVVRNPIHATGVGLLLYRAQCGGKRCGGARRWVAGCEKSGSGCGAGSRAISKCHPERGCC